jgi:hypothetical protein
MENRTTGSIDALNGACEVSECEARVGRARNTALDVFWSVMAGTLVFYCPAANFFEPVNFNRNRHIVHADSAAAS